MPGLTVHHQLPELVQTHVHPVGDAINHLILCCPLLLLPFQRSESFPVSQLFESDGQSVGALASTGTKYHSLAGIDNRNKFSHSSGARSLSADLVSSEASLLGLHMAAFLSCPHKVFPLCVCMPLLSLFMSNFFVEGHQPD